MTASNLKEVRVPRRGMEGEKSRGKERASENKMRPFWRENFFASLHIIRVFWHKTIEGSLNNLHYVSVYMLA